MRFRGGQEGGGVGGFGGEVSISQEGGGTGKRGVGGKGGGGGTAAPRHRKPN